MKDITERETVVAFLREQAAIALGLVESLNGGAVATRTADRLVTVIDAAADAIERGDHLPKEQNDG